MGSPGAVCSRPGLGISIPLLMLLLGGWGLLSGCGGDAGNKKGEGVLILADQSLQPVVEAELQVFSARYPDTRIGVRYGSPAQMAKLWLAGKGAVLWLGRRLKREEQVLMKPSGTAYETYTFGFEGIAVVSGPAFPDTVIPFTDLRNWFQGRSRTLPPPVWAVWEPFSEGALLEAVLDSLRFNGTLAVKQRVAPEVEALADSLREDTRAIGLLNTAWVGDGDHPASQALRASLRLLRIQQPGDSVAWLPAPAPVAEGRYPFVRCLYLYKRENGPGPGARFIAFCLDQDGQRIALKAGVVPARIPGREILIRKD